MREIMNCPAAHSISLPLSRAIKDPLNFFCETCKHPTGWSESLATSPHKLPIIFRQSVQEPKLVTEIPGA